MTSGSEAYLGGAFSGPEDASAHPDYAAELTHKRSVRLLRRGVGRKLTGLDQAVQQLGMYAEETGQILTRPKAPTHIPYMNFAELRPFVAQRNGSKVMARLRATIGQLNVETLQVPYELFVSPTDVFVCVQRDTWESSSREIDDFRTSLEVPGAPPTLHAADQAFHDIPLLQCQNWTKEFVTRVEELNNSDLRCDIGRLALLCF